jgi:hypothetical protein
VVLGLWGDEAARRTGYTLTLTDSRHGIAILRRHATTLGMARLPTGGPVRRIILSREPTKRREEIAVWADGRKLISKEDDEAIPPAELWRVGLRAGLTGNTVITSVRITGRPDWARLRAELRKRGAAAADLPSDDAR